MRHPSQLISREWCHPGPHEAPSWPGPGVQLAHPSAQGLEGVRSRIGRSDVAGLSMQLKREQKAYLPHSISSLIGDLERQELDLQQDQGSRPEFIISFPRRDDLFIGVDEIALDELGMYESEQRVTKVGQDVRVIECADRVV
jgi:hypothetical protein